MHETVKTQKLYYLHNTRSAYFPINRRLHRDRVRERQRERETEREREVVREQETERERKKEAMSIREMVKTQNQDYLHNTRSAYFPINRRLHRKRESVCV